MRIDCPRVSGSVRCPSDRVHITCSEAPLAVVPINVVVDVVPRLKDTKPELSGFPVLSVTIVCETELDWVYGLSASVTAGRVRIVTYRRGRLPGQVGPWAATTLALDGSGGYKEWNCARIGSFLQGQKATSQSKYPNEWNGANRYQI